MRELVELHARIAEIERKMDGMLRHGPVHERKKIEGEWHVRIKMGGTDSEPTLSPWLPYTVANGGPNGLNIHRVPAKGEQMSMLSPSGDPRQAVLLPYFWSNDHKPPSNDEDALTITHPKFKLNLKDGELSVESSEVVNVKASKTITLDAGESVTLKVGSTMVVLTADAIVTVGRTWIGMDDKNERPPIKVATMAGPAKQAFSKVG